MKNQADFLREKTVVWLKIMAYLKLRPSLKSCLFAVTRLIIKGGQEDKFFFLFSFLDYQK